MNKIKTVLSIGAVAFVTVAWGIDEHRPIQGGTTNPTPTGPTDHTPIQAEPESTVDTTIVTPTPPPPAPRLNPKKKTQTKPQTKPQTGGGTTGSTGTGANMQNGNKGGGSSGSTGDGTYNGTTPQNSKTTP